MQFQLFIHDLAHFIQLAAVFLPEGVDVAVQDGAHVADLAVLLRLLRGHLGREGA